MAIEYEVSGGAVRRHCWQHTRKHGGAQPRPDAGHIKAKFDAALRSAGGDPT